MPLFYERGGDSLPRGWIAMMQRSMQTLCPTFNTNRMVNQYLDQAYLPALARRLRLEEGGYKRAKALARWRGKVQKAWRDVRVAAVEADVPADPRVGGSFEVRARVAAGKLTAADLSVQVYAGRVDDRQEIVGAELVPLEYRETASDGALLFAGLLPCSASGLRGFTVRVLPRHEDLGHPHATGLIAWA